MKHFALAEEEEKKKHDESKSELPGIVRINKHIHKNKELHIY